MIDDNKMGELFALDRYDDEEDPRDPQGVAPLWAMQRPRGGGILPGEDVNSFPTLPSTFQASAGTEDFDRMYRLASGGGGGDDNKMKMLMMMGGG